MIFHENIIHYSCRKLGEVSPNLLSAAVVIGALRVNTLAAGGFIVSERVKYVTYVLLNKSLARINKT